LTDQPALRFPDGFLWGASTSSYQIEGAVEQDGRGPSIWDTQCSIAGRVRNGDRGDVAADHYNRMPQDVALMKDLGLGAYRFSVAWPRVQPTGSGAVNQAGLDFYSRLVDELLAAGIKPMLTLYHWDLPQPLQDAGGWPARETAYRFAEYAGVVFEALRDRVELWTTLNEPWCSSVLGYLNGEHAPGEQDPVRMTRAIHHLLLAHGLGLEAMRAIDPGPRHSIVLNNTRTLAGVEDPSDALREGMRRSDGIRNRVWTEPLFAGRYPEDVVRDLEPYGGLPVEDGDLEVIAQPLDWLGLNYYNDDVFVEAPGAVFTNVPGLTGIAGAEVGPIRTDMEWRVTPDGLRGLMADLTATYPDLPPLYVTENGAAYDDPVVDGAVHDDRRIAYLDGHVRAVHQAIEEGVDVRGYFEWSLMDNFEWGFGYAMRFGMVHIDYDTLVRTPKDSAYWYRDVIRRHGLPAG
jgi:beta-glucosidase